ncbi:metal-dependent hydrolase [Zhongshania marina]|jgi:predicted metal-dependent hydrolase|uniref:Metal-dependent hydrolase n=1 Tax=Zhongshania marina TaxID=2304603 RepID=A0A2S4HGQ3_9GAMM|nr:metal-dependent hydrolase [Marortus luteolus]POP53168.1 metal-dependent hydrolase [Marortus luteolus]RNL64443.1 metal-dependent hydrolase [Zhongshania marina]
MNIKPEARKIECDFSKARIDWIPKDPELAQFWNAVSIGLPLLEGYLIRALAKSKKLLPEDREDLYADCELFCKQEANHSKTHMAFNDMVRGLGYYPEMDKYTDKLRADYERFDREYGLRHAMLYAEGFETAGPIFATYFLVQANKRLKDNDVDLITLSLWRWHLSEEFEHRCCAFNVVEALYGTYWGRVGGIMKATFHLLGFAVPLSEYMQREDKKAGRMERGPKAMLRKLSSYSGMFFFITPRILRACTPWYNPKNLKAPAGCEEVLTIASETLDLNKMAERARETIPA